MFTARTLSLSSLDGQFGLTVLRDCDFAYLGKIPTSLEKRLVPAASRLHIDNAVAETGVIGIVTTAELAELVPPYLGVATSISPLETVISMQHHIGTLPDFQWQSFDSKIHPTALIYPGAYVAPRDVKIGEGSIIYPNAVIMPRSIIGKNCSIGPGSVVSADAFEVDISSKPYRVVTQSGGVFIADNVDVQAKCTLVRSTFGGFTELGEGTKLDCQVHLAHDCWTGKNVRIAACAEISGRVNIEDDVFIGPNASISNGITIGARAKVTIGAVVTRNVREGTTVTGNFAVEHRKWLLFMRTLK